MTRDDNRRAEGRRYPHEELGAQQFVKVGLRRLKPA
jgi:hypothetical protein